MGGTVPVGQTRIERGFIGAHADIGGGFGPNDNQLAQVVLAWMVDQAEAAGVTMQAPPSTIIANPVIHDKSNNIQTGRPKEGFLVGGEDRQVRYLNGTTTTQRKMTGSGMTYVDTDQFISYFDRDTLERAPGRLDENGDIVDDFIMTNKTGTVDMRGYLDWLNANGYNINLTVQ